MNALENAEKILIDYHPRLERVKQDIVKDLGKQLDGTYVVYYLADSNVLGPVTPSSLKKLVPVGVAIPKDHKKWEHVVDKYCNGVNTGLRNGTSKASDSFLLLDLKKGKIEDITAMASMLTKSLKKAIGEADWLIISDEVDQYELVKVKDDNADTRGKCRSLNIDFWKKYFRYFMPYHQLTKKDKRNLKKRLRRGGLQTVKKDE